MEVWDYFVFPSINWEAKGYRITHLLDTIGLRPENTLVLDDIQSNLGEILHYNPGINTCIYDDWLKVDFNLWGKDDKNMTGLAQYHLLEKKQDEKTLFSGSNQDFLKTCNIQVVITPTSSKDEDLPRIEELINRTNQLNYTKVRLIGGLSQLVFYLKYKSMHSYKIIVKDKYGDYGLCGFISIDKDNQLKHFLFSCRLMSMDVDRALYHYMFKKHAFTPPTNFENFNEPIDWINITETEVYNEKIISQGPKILLTFSCFGEALTAFLNKSIKADSTYNLYSLEINKKIFNKYDLAMPIEEGDKAKFKDLFDGAYDFLAICPGLIVWSPTLNLIGQKITTKVFPFYLATYKLLNFTTFSPIFLEVFFI